MGQTCSGCNCQNQDDTNTMDFSSKNNGNIESGVRNMKINVDYELLNKFNEQDIPNIVKI